MTYENGDAIIDEILTVNGMRLKLAAIGVCIRF